MLQGNIATPLLQKIYKTKAQDILLKIPAENDLYN